MFFHIADQHQENYPCHWQLGSFCVSTDSGWQLKQVGTAQVLYKGYADRAELTDLLLGIVLQTTPHVLGNFCAMVLVDGTLSIQTDRYRSFPIYIGDHSVNNLIPTSRTAWTDSMITIHSDLAVTENKFDVIGNIGSAISTVDQIDELLIDKIQKFLSHNQLPLRVFLSGGVDTLLLYSYVRRLGAKYEMTWNLHTDLDEFYLANSSDIKKNWGYRQIHHWQTPCVLTSGTPGDEFMLRSPTTANQYLLSHGTSIPEQLQLHPNCLHRDYFSQYTDLFNSQHAGTAMELCNTVVNDWQHWHLGNTLTWTPFRDLELFKLFLALPYEKALAQIMDSAVSRELIERNVPGLTQVLSDQKNSNNALKNLRGLLNLQC
jgi:hypothetical protein